MSKKIGILTIIDKKNIGNRLQNFALQEFLKENRFYAQTIRNAGSITFRLRIKWLMKSILKEKNRLKRLIRYLNFRKFNKNIHFSNIYIYKCKKSNLVKKSFKYVIAGSDQVWNCTFINFSDIYFLPFVDPKKRIAFSASFGINEIPEDKRDYYKNRLNEMNKISVREERGKEIIEELTGRKDVEVLLDPTMLIETESWENVSKKPKQWDKIEEEKYILNYFLGKLSEKRRAEIERVAKENNCKIINILDKNDPFYSCGPSEFLYLEKNAFLVCTDSFHSSVFAILFNTPFVVFDREDSTTKMNSRLDTLLKKFNIQDRWFDKKIKDSQMIADYKNVNKILNEERSKAKKFITEALKEEN